MKTRTVCVRLMSLMAVCAVGCSSYEQGAADGVSIAERDTPDRVIREVRGVTLGEPLAVAIDFNGNLLVADGLPGRVVRISPLGDDAMEFERPRTSPGFYPTALKVSGFYAYAMDAVGRQLLRYDQKGAYLDILIRFDDASAGGPMNPVGMDVDGTGRIVVSDVKNHQVAVFNTYLQVELAFGNYGSSPGQFDSPEGVSFTTDGGLLVADSGNRRVQLFDASGTFIRAVPATGADNPLRRPRRAVTDPVGNIFVADPQAGRVCVFDTSGALVRTIVPGGTSRFRPMGIAVSRSGMIYVADTANNALYVFR